MILINTQPLDVTAMMNEYPESSVERVILDKLSSGSQTFPYSSVNQLKFELRLRREIINAANALHQSRMSFKIFRKSTCNPDFWVRQENGGFTLKRGVKPSDGIRDIFINSSMYGTECATAMVIIYYKALLEVFPEDTFNKMFPSIYLMNWHQIDRELREIGQMPATNTFVPGDRRYFANPDVDPLTPEWQGENVIDMAGGLYYGHGIGKFPPDEFIKALNENRKEDADESAYFMNSAGRPNFKRLSNLYDRAVT